MTKQFVAVFALLAAVLGSKASSVHPLGLNQFFHLLNSNPGKDLYRPPRSAVIDVAAKSYGDKQSLSLESGTSSLGRGYPAGTYPASNFISYAANCRFGSTTDKPIYTIESVSDLWSCGFEYCYGDKDCSHFNFIPSTTKTLCEIYAKSKSGTTWGTRNQDYQCGILPDRACDVSLGVSSFLGCLALDIKPPVTP